VTPVTGAARVVRCAPKVALALGYDVDAALERAEFNSSHPGDAAEQRPSETGRHPSTKEEQMNNESRVTGWWVFAGILLALAGFLNVVWGIAGVSDSKFFTANSVWVVSSLHTWGWITLIIGVIQLIAAFSLFSGGGFGRVIGIVAAGIGAIAALAGTGSTPFWSICVFALCVTVVYQLCKPSREVAT
jgi:hypothetical protein